MKKSFTRAKALLVAGLAMIASNAAFAQSTKKAGDIAEDLQDQFGAFANIATGGAMLVGIFIGIAALMKFKAYNENPQQTKISTPIVLTLVAAALIALPTYLSMTRNTVIEGGQGNSVDNKVYDKIG